MPDEGSGGAWIGCSYSLGLRGGGSLVARWRWGRASPEEVLTQQEIHSRPNSTHHAKAVG